MGYAVQLEQPAPETIRRLAKLGITGDDVKYVGTAMVLAGMSYNPLGPRSESGNLRYARGVSAWAETLMPSGWKRESPDGCELITSPDDRVSICVTSGDHNVGMLSDPKTRYPRGTVTRERIAENQAQLGMPSILGPAKVARGGVPQLWMTLHNVVQNRLYMELSLPKRIEGDARKVAWDVRLRLGVYGWVGESPADENGDSNLGKGTGPIITIRPK